MVIGSHDFTWLTKLRQHIHVDEAIEEVVLKEREGGAKSGRASSRNARGK